MQNDDMTGTNRIIRALGTTATVEAVTWAGLLVGMVFKRVLEASELGVQVFGPLHGAAFLAYSVSAVLTWRLQRWSGATGALALLAGLPPFGTVVFHRWARRTGRLLPAPGEPAFSPISATAQLPRVADSVPPAG